MKYKCYAKNSKAENKGGAYWKNTAFNDHLNLTEYQTTYNYMIKNFPSTIRVLEAGCGLGRWVVPLSKLGYNVTGIDIEADAINTINKCYKANNLQVIVGDIFNMPFEANKFDIVLSLGVLEHFENNNLQAKALSEHRRVLKDDGYFLITVPYFNLQRLLIHFPYKYLNSFIRKMKGEREYFTEYRYSLSTIKNTLKHNKFQIVKIIWDDLQPPYSFGLTVDNPIRYFTRSNEKIDYKLNKFSILLQKFLWKIHPSIISGGIGLLCKKSF